MPRKSVVFRDSREEMPEHGAVILLVATRESSGLTMLALEIDTVEWQWEEVDELGSTGVTIMYTEGDEEPEACFEYTYRLVTVVADCVVRHKGGDTHFYWCPATEMDVFLSDIGG